MTPDEQGALIRRTLSFARRECRKLHHREKDGRILVERGTPEGQVPTRERGITDCTDHLATLLSCPNTALVALVAPELSSAAEVVSA